MITQELIQKAQQGNRQAINELVELSTPFMYSIVLKQTDNPNDTDDLVQNALIVLITKLKTLTHWDKYFGWLRTVTRNSTINFYKNRARLNTVALAIDIEEPPTLDPVEKEEETNLLHQCLNQLKEQDKQLLLDFYFGGSSVLQLAASYQVPEGTIKRRLFTARGRLRDLLVKAPVSLSNSI